MTTPDTEVIARGGFKKVDAQRRVLSDAGLRAEVVCPPGVTPKG